MKARLKRGHCKDGRGINPFATIYAQSAPNRRVERKRGTSMRNAPLMLVILAAGLGASSCQSPRATFERTFLPDPAKPYLGMSKEQIIACAGPPSGSYSTNTGDTLTYHYSGAGPVPTAAPKKQDDSKKSNPFGGKKSDNNYDCAASLAFEGGHLVRVTFAPRLAVSPYQTKNDPTTGKKVLVDQPKPCTFSLPNCGAH
jgi:hypothetical protein